MRTTDVKIEDGRYSVFAEITRCGRDVNITIGGGEKPHIGAVAVSVPRPSLHDPEKISASTSVICITGHKEDSFAKTAAERISSECNCAASVSVGVHIDNAETDELLRLEANLSSLLEAVVEALK